MHDNAYIGRLSENNINASCMTILGGRTKQLYIFCRITGFTSDFFSFIVVELIQFFHGAIQLLDSYMLNSVLTVEHLILKCCEFLSFNLPFKILFIFTPYRHNVACLL